MIAIKAHTTNQPSILESLSIPNFQGKGELDVQKGKLVLNKNKIYHLTSEGDEKITNIARAFIERVNTDIAQRLDSGEKDSLNFTNIEENFKEIQDNLAGRTTDAKNAIKAVNYFAKAKYNVHKLQKEEFQGNFEGISRRVTRYALYQLYSNGYFQSLSSAISFPTMMRTAAYGVGSFFSAAGTAVGATASAAGSSATAAASGTASAFSSFVMPNVMHYLPGFLTFLAITEGPGVVGHLARRLTPNPVKYAYNKVTPSFVQKAVNFVFHTDKFVARKLDTALQGLAILLG